MQFKTIRETKSGSWRYMRSTGSQGRFFAFDYQVRHDPASECVGVQLHPDVTELGPDGFWSDIHAGLRTGCDEALQRSVRLCCSNVLITLIKVHDVDTTPQAVRACLAEFIQERVVEWANPIDPLRPEWLTSDVIALARGIHADTAFDRLPILSDALQDAGCADPLVLDHLKMCSDHGPSCWVVEMILGQVL